MDEWNTSGKFIFAAIFVLYGVFKLFKGEHSYGGWVGDFYDSDSEVVLTGWRAAVLNMGTISCGIAFLFGFGWVLLVFAGFMLVRKALTSEQFDS